MTKQNEREIERELVKHITSFLLELGTGFSFVGKQVPLAIEELEAEFSDVSAETNESGIIR